MAKRMNSIPLHEVIDYCLQDDYGDEDSSVGGLSSDEEDDLDQQLLGNISSDDEKLSSRFTHFAPHNNAMFTFISQRTKTVFRSGIQPNITEMQRNNLCYIMNLLY